MSAAAPLQAQARRKVVALPQRSGATIDVEKLLLQGQSAPKVLVPKELQAAIDRRARELSQQAYTLCREHLSRRVAYTCEYGYPERKLLMNQAFAVIAEGDLGDALAHEYKRKLKRILGEVESIQGLSVELGQEIKLALAKLAPQ